MTKYENMCYHYNRKNEDIQLINDNLNKSKQKILFNITNIIKNINNMRENTSKKYQISGQYEYNMINELIKDIPNIKYSLIKDDVQKHRILTNMSGYYDSRCCDACDIKREYTYTHLPVMYITVKKL